jgi:hypothetical protein
MLKLSLTYRFLRFLGLNYSEEEYGQVTIYKVFKRVIKTYRDGFLLKYVMESWLLAPILPRMLGPWIVRRIGAKVGKNVFIGSKVWIDSGHADMLILEDHVHIAGVIIGLDSLVNKDIPDNSVYAGVPARYICSFDDYVIRMTNYSDRMRSLYKIDKLKVMDHDLAKKNYIDFLKEKNNSSDIS